MLYQGCQDYDAALHLVKNLLRQAKLKKNEHQRLVAEVERERETLLVEKAQLEKIVEDKTNMINEPVWHSGVKDCFHEFRHLQHTLIKCEAEYHNLARQRESLKGAPTAGQASSTAGDET